MKKLVAFAAVIAAVSFASCGNKSAENTEVVAPAEQATTEETAVAEGDSTAVEAPAAETEAAPAE